MRIGNKIGMFSVFALLSATAFAQKPVQITGESKMTYKQPAHVYKVDKGQPVAIADVQVTKDGKFGFIFYPEYEGLYVVGSGTDSNPMYSHTFWFKEGDKLAFTFDDNGYELDEKVSSKENKVLHEWYMLTQNLRQQSIDFGNFPGTYVEFFPELEKVVSLSKVWSKTKKTGNAKFDKQHDLAFYAANFLHTPRKLFPTDADMIPYYETIGVEKMYRNTADVYQYPWGKRALNSRFMFEMKKRKLRPGSDLQSIKAIVDFIPNDTLKGDYILEQLARVRNFKDYKLITDALGKYILTEEQQYRNVMMLAPMIVFTPGDNAGNVQGIKAVLDFIPNDTLKGDFVLSRLSGVKSYADYIGITDELSKYFMTAAQQQRNLRMISPLMVFKAGDAAFNFNLADNNGKMMSLADLKGKIVLVDVWATWCAPCKAEIPFLKQLEAEFKGTDLQIVGISVDEANDKEKWSKMIKDEQLGGIHLFAGGFTSAFATYYKLTAIPRFMLFDRDGKIIAVQAPRPSGPALKVLLKQHLAK